MQRPVIALLAALIGGIACGHYARIPEPPLWTAMLTSLAVSWYAWRKGWHLPLHLALLGSFFVLGILQFQMRSDPRLDGAHLVHRLSSEKISLEGMICENPRVSPDKTELVVCASRIIQEGHYHDTAGRVLLSATTADSFRYGDVIRVHARLSRPRNFGNPGAFDYEEYLRLRGILVRGYVTDAGQIVLLRREAGAPPRTVLERARDRIRQLIRDHAPPVEGTIIQAMILGEQGEIPQEIWEQFSKTGTTHLIAISGFNIGIVALFALWMMRLLLRRSELLLLYGNVPYLETLAAMLAVILYTFIAGAGISVIRASLMVLAFMVSLLMNRDRDLFNAMGLAALLILTVSPASLFDVSFQLSFVAVASLLLWVPRLTMLLPKPLPAGGEGSGIRPIAGRLLHRCLQTTLVFVFVTLSATLGTLPLILFYFNRLSLVSLAANLAVVPVLGILATPVCLLLVLAVPISAVFSGWILAAASLLVRISLILIEWFASFPWASLFVCTPTTMEVATFYLLMAAAVYWCDRVAGQRPAADPRSIRLAWTILPILPVFLWIVGWVQDSLRPRQSATLSLTAVDVGQGSSVLIRLPGGRRMLVDGGGFFDETFDVGKSVLAPFLWQQKIGTIETVVLTHPHPDHLQGLLFILEHFGVREVWMSGYGTDSPLYLSFLETIGRRGIDLRVLSQQSPPFRLSGAEFLVLNPAEKAFGRVAGMSPAGLHRNASGNSGGAERIPVSPPEDLNELSLVLRLSFGTRHFLLAGDIAERSEAQLLKSGRPLASDVLLVPHHGSARSSGPGFLAAVRPTIGIISCGKGNVFGFPRPELVKRYEDIGCRLYRTDRDGAVTVTSDGATLKTDTFYRAPR